MAQTESEKLLADTLRKLEADGRITWGHKLEAQVRGQKAKFRTSAPIDFVIVMKGADPLIYFVEVKECGGTSIGYSTFKPRQRRLLNELPNAFLLLRFYSPKFQRNNIHYWEHYFWVRARQAVPEDAGIKGSVTLSSLSAVAGNLSSFVWQIAGQTAGCVWGAISEAGGLTTRGKLTRGFTSLPLNLLE